MNVCFNEMLLTDTNSGHFWPVEDVAFNPGSRTLLVTLGRNLI